VWPLGEEWDEQRVEHALFGERQVVKRLPRTRPPGFSRLALRCSSIATKKSKIGRCAVLKL
jgi:hypothetical protein